MAQVLIRNLKPDVLERLKARAARHNRSLEAELRHIVTEAGSPPAKITEETRRLQALFAGRAFTDSAVDQRDDRKR
ncbi:MAG: hypothetical protein GYA63_02955 [Armatimonadetes bacterium]|nr:hypothetical protein [Armatimonadota bacterium]